MQVLDVVVQVGDLAIVAGILKALGGMGVVTIADRITSAVNGISHLPCAV